MAAPTKPPITTPGPKIPPEPPVPIDSEVATIFAIGRTMTIHNGIAIKVSLSDANCTQPYPLDRICGISQCQQSDQQSADRRLEHRRRRGS